MNKIVVLLDGLAPRPVFPFLSEACFSVTLIVMTRNLARNKRRRHYLAMPHDSEAADGDTLPANKLSVEELVVQAEEHVALLGCIEKLKVVQKHVLKLRLLEHRAGSEVAKILDMQPGHVAVVLNRAKASLIECNRDKVVGLNSGKTKDP